MGERQRNRRGQGGRLRQEILDAAHEILLESGHEAAVTIRGVARQAGIAAQSCYLHFATRDQLLWALYEREFEQLRALLAEASTEGGTPAERLRACARAFCAYAVDEPGAYGLLFQARGVAEHAWGEGLPGQPTIDLWIGLVADCVGADRDAATVATDLWAALHGSASLRRDLPAFVWPGTQDEAVDRLIEALVAPEGGTAPSR